MAIQNLEQAIIFDPKNPHYHEILADIYKEMRIPDEEAKSIKRATEIYLDARGQ